jgi:pimeloyl-ACP methyl ester carboxylesterase
MHGAAQNPPSRPILFVHGWCGSPYDWAPFFGPLTQTFPAALYTNQTVYLVQYNSVSNTFTYWTETTPSAGASTALVPIAESAIPATARFFVLQLYDPNPSSTDRTSSINVAKISILNKAYEIAQVVNHIASITQVPQVNILAHSMGGLDARAYAEGMASAGACYDYSSGVPDYTASTCTPGSGGAAYAGNLANIVTLDTPNAGSPLANSALLADSGISSLACQASGSTNNVEITPASDLLQAINYAGSALGGASPIPLAVPVQAIEDYASDVELSWTGLTGYSDDVVQKTSQSIDDNVSAANSTATLVDIPIPYLSSAIAGVPGCNVTVPILSISEPLIHLTSCLGELAPTQQAIESQLVSDTVPWISSWSVTPTALAAGATVTASYSATDLSSSTLASAQLLRAPDVNGQPGTWAAVGAAQTLSGNGPTNVTLEDTPPAGIYWYGTRLTDAAGNVSMQPQAIEVTVSGTTASPSFSVSGTAVTVTPGATTGNTSTISVTPAGGFTGAVALSASVTSSPAGAVQPPTLSFGNTATVSITGTSAATATLTIATTAPTSPPCTTSSLTDRDFPWLPASGSALAFSLFFVVPRRRRIRRMLSVVVLMGAFAGGLTGCVRHQTTACTNVIAAGTTPGTYQITVTATSGSTSQQTVITLTVQ